MKLDDEFRIPKSPRRIAAEAAIAVGLLAAVVGGILVVALSPDDRPFERGVLLGTGLAPVILLVYVIALFRARKKQQQQQ